MDQQLISEKSYWTKRRKVLSNVDSFLGSCSTNTSSTEIDNCVTYYCATILWQGLAAGLFTCGCSVGNWLPSIKERAGGTVSAK